MNKGKLPSGFIEGCRKSLRFHDFTFYVLVCARDTLFAAKSQII